jgi:two-component system, chemotaxis family, sensor kinase Cph1
VAGRDIVWSIEHLPTVLADATMLHLVMSNLIGNAVKYTGGKGRAHISIGAQSSVDELSQTREVLVWVEDNGVGFDMQYVDKLFGVFQRLHGDGQFEGTGIGLATVKRVIRRHGGRTWAKGALGSGASFYFTLPTEDPDHE